MNRQYRGSRQLACGAYFSVDSPVMTGVSALGGTVGCQVAGAVEVRWRREDGGFDDTVLKLLPGGKIKNMTRAADEADEQTMVGGVNTVVRTGTTVRRPTGPWTPAVHALLEHLAARGFTDAPRAHGIDEQGRQILDYVEGEVLNYPLSAEALSDEGLESVGRLLRQYHEATLGFRASPDTTWYFPAREPVEVVCHGDFAPHNLVFRDGRAAAVIDFDTAHPGPRLWDFAWTAFCFGLSVMDGDDPVGERIHRVRILADAYALAPEEREALPDATIARLRHLVTHIREQAAAGHPSFSTHVAEGHDLRYLEAAEEIEQLRDELITALRED